MVEPRNFIFGMRIDHKEYSPKMLLRSTTAASWLVQQQIITYYKSKMGRRHVGFSINANNFGVNRHTSMKLGGIK